MRVTVFRKEVLAAWSLLVSVSKVVRIVVNEESVRLDTFNAECSIAVDVDVVESCVDSDEEQQFMVAGDVLSTILRESTSDHITFEVLDDHVHVTTGTAQFWLNRVQQEFSNSDTALSDSWSISVSAIRLVDSLLKTVICCDDGGGRYTLEAICCEVVSGDELALVATDGRRLVATRSEVHDVDAAVGSVALISEKVARFVCRAVSVVGGKTVKMSANANEVVFSADKWLIKACQLSGRFPDWQNAVPALGNYHLVKTASHNLLSSVRQAAIVTDVESRAVKVCISNGLLEVHSQTQGIGNSTVSMEAEYSGPTLDVTLNSQFLLEWLAATKHEQTMSLFVKDSNFPVVFKTSDDSVCVVMPLVS